MITYYFKHIHTPTPHMQDTNGDAIQSMGHNPISLAASPSAPVDSWSAPLSSLPYTSPHPRTTSMRDIPYMIYT